MPNAKRISITTDSSEVFIIRAKSKKTIRGFCGECQKETELLTLDEAVSLSGIKTFEIVSRLTKGEIHFLETESGHLLVCLNSLEGFTYPKEGV